MRGRDLAHASPGPLEILVRDAALFHSERGRLECPGLPIARVNPDDRELALARASDDQPVPP